MIRLFLVSLILFFLTGCYCPNSDRAANPTVYTCGAEKVENGKFIEDEVQFGYGVTQSSDCAHTGKYSAKVNHEHPYSMEYKIEKVKKGDYVNVQVWRKSESAIGEIIIESKLRKSKTNSQYVIREEKGWELIECEYLVEDDFDEIKIFVYNGHEETVYFDDIRIEYYHNLKKPKGSEEEQIHITIPQSALDSLNMFRKKAIEQDVISSEMKNYFNASIKINGKNVPVKLRLKGDWTDHVKTEKWSMRIKIDGDETYQGMKKFSIQNPSTRSFMMEWFAHKLFEREDILTTRYTFRVVYLNGQNMGVYALEEHFDKRLLENRKRREGPIVKFDETAFWEDNIKKMKGDAGSLGTFVPYERIAEVVPFSDGRTRKTPTLHKQFLVARSKMEQYRNRDTDVGSYFDMDKMAKFLAMQDVINSNHGMAWHNQRNYFNPVNNLMEPIGYDCFPYKGSIKRRPPILAKFAREIGAERCFFEMALFQNEEFEQTYLKYLELFTSEDYLKNCMTNLKVEIENFEKLIKSEYPKYKFDFNFFTENCRLVQSDLNAYKSKMSENFSGQLKPVSEPWESRPNQLNKKASLYVHREKIDSLTAYFTLSNVHATDISVVGYSFSSDNDSIIKISPINLKAYINQADSKKVLLPDNASYFYFTAKNCGDSIFRVKSSKWSPYKDINDLEGAISIEKYATLSGDLYTLKSGAYEWNKTVYVPQGYRLKIMPGVRINFTKSAGFISYSPVDLAGNSESPISISSSDKSGSGFTVIANNKDCSFTHVDFSDMNTMRSETRVLTGACTVYEANIKLNNCTFSDNHCEDGLNLIRSTFEMNNCTVQRTYADGFDADFCTGNVTNCHFLETANDCIDFSGSEINIIDCEIKGSGDKGISGGENSTLTVRNCSISNANIGVAAKDFSRVNISNSTIEACSFAFSAYRKKPEFGEAVVTAQSVKLTNCKKVHLVELGSRVIVNGSEYKGKEKFDIDSMYAAFSK